MKKGTKVSKSLTVAEIDKKLKKLNKKHEKIGRQSAKAEHKIEELMDWTMAKFEKKRRKVEAQQAALQDLRNGLINSQNNGPAPDDPDGDDGETTVTATIVPRTRKAARKAAKKLKRVGRATIKL